MYGFRGSLRLHRSAIGWDILRAPVNVLMVLPAAVVLAVSGLLTVSGARQAANRLRDRRLFLPTRVGRELEWALYTEFLELPYRRGGRASDRDALAERILADPRVAGPLGAAYAALGSRIHDPVARERIDSALAAYGGSRAAAADLSNAFAMMGIGALAFKKLTPGAISLGPALAGALTQQAAVAAFPLGASFGSIWYGVFPAKPSALALVGSTGGMIVVASLCAAFAGVLADPLQRRLGLHQRRLRRLVDTMERNLSGDDDARLIVRDHYVSRLLDLFDVTRAILRSVHG